MSHPEDPDDLFIWPDGTYCYRSEVGDMERWSDDYIVLHVDSEEWLAFDPDNPLKRLES